MNVYVVTHEVNALKTVNLSKRKMEDAAGTYDPATASDSHKFEFELWVLACIS